MTPVLPRVFREEKPRKRPLPTPRGQEFAEQPSARPRFSHLGADHAPIPATMARSTHSPGPPLASPLPLLALLCTLAGGLISGAGRAQSKADVELLYSLETQCSLAGEQRRCTVEAFDAKGTTLYRTTVGEQRRSFRLIDQPNLRGAQVWDEKTKGWVGMDRLSLDFKTNTLCVNGESLCFINPNYFGSLRAEFPKLRSTLIEVRFDAKDGRLAAICYSEQACDAGF